MIKQYIFLLRVKLRSIFKNICYYCDGDGEWYGVAPHDHNFEMTGSYINSTVLHDKEKWPDNFTEDKDCEGLGVYTCIYCKGTGKRK